MSNISTWSIGWLFFAAGVAASATSVRAEEPIDISSNRSAQYSAATSSWPSRSNTGVPAGVTPEPYTDPCKITIPQTTIDAKLVNCDLLIRAAVVVITRSKVNVYISSDTEKSTG